MNGKTPICKTLRKDLGSDFPSAIAKLSNPPVGIHLPNAPRQFRPTHLTSSAKTRGRLSASYQSWYQTATWKALRKQVLHRDCFLCQECMRNGIIKAVKEHTTHDDPSNQAHADHKKAHKGDWSRFIDFDGIECLCGDCHRRKIVLEDGGFGR